MAKFRQFELNGITSVFKIKIHKNATFHNDAKGTTHWASSGSPGQQFLTLLEWMNRGVIFSEQAVFQFIQRFGKSEFFRKNCS